MIQRTLSADEIKYLPASLGVSDLADIEKALLDYLNAYIASLVAKNKADEKAVKISVLVASKDPRVDALYEELKPVIKEVAEK
jgi:hypothetical protein